MLRGEPYKGLTSQVEARNRFVLFVLYHLTESVKKEKGWVVAVHASMLLFSKESKVMKHLC
jgi:hypothetical protein